MAMEASIANVLERGETLLVGNNGIWGARVCDLADRYGLKVRTLLSVAPHVRVRAAHGLTYPGVNPGVNELV
jgi:aspartate aminotransferase-like enzyme